MCPFVKPSASALLCLCLVGERWGKGQTPPVHCCSWTQDVSVLVLMQAQRHAFILSRKHPTTGQRTKAVMLRTRGKWGFHQHVTWKCSCTFSYAFRHWPSEDSSDTSIVTFKCFKYPSKSDPSLMFFMWFIFFILFVILHMCVFPWIEYWWSPIKIFVTKSNKPG